MATYYVDYEGGNDANSGVDFANRWKTITSGATAARIAPGDTIRIMASPDPTSLGINATWTNQSPNITLASALNVLVTNCDSAWTASPNVTCTTNTVVYRTATASASAAIAAGFTTGLAAYLALGGAQDYSAYQGLTFWIYVNAPVAASTLSLRLCSDAAGATTVDTLAIPALPVSNAWYPIYVDKGSALGASIQSIALYADLDPGTVTVLLDNISTVKAAGADNLNLTTLISKNTAGEYWWALRSINGTAVVLDASPVMTPTLTAEGYVGTTESVETYKRNVIPVTPNANEFRVQDSGTAGNLITFSGGWNRTDMSTQTGNSYFDHRIGTSATGWDSNLQTYWSLDKLFAVRCATGILIGPANNTLGDVGSIAHGTIGLSLGSAATNLTIGNVSVIQGLNTGMGLSAAGVTATSLTALGVTSGTGISLNGRGYKVTTMRAENIGGPCLQVGTLSTPYSNVDIGTATLNNGTYGIQTIINTQDFCIRSLTANSNSTIGLQLPGGVNVQFGSVTLQNNAIALSIPTSFVNCDARIGYLTTSGNTTVISGTTFLGNLAINGSNFGEASPLSFSGSAYTSGRVKFENFDDTANDHRIYYSSGTNGATIFADATTRHSSQGLSWKFNILNTTFITESFPAVVSVGRVALRANKQATISIWCRRSSTDMHGTLRCKGQQIQGVANDVTASMSAAINTWQQLSLIFTPTEQGVVDIDFTCYGVTSQDLFIHDFTAVQEV